MLNTEPRLELPGFTNSLDLTRLMLVGHSFGGATALTILARRPHLFHRAVLLDPALDWAAHDVHSDILPEHLQSVCTPAAPVHRQQVPVKGSVIITTAAAETAMAHNGAPVLLVYSESWGESGYGLPSEMGKLVAAGRFPAGSRACLLRGASHVAFSDVGVIMPPLVLRLLQFLRPGACAAATLAVSSNLTIRFLTYASPNENENGDVEEQQQVLASPEFQSQVVEPIPAALTHLGDLEL